MPPVVAALPGVLLNVAAGIAVNAAVGLVSNAIFGNGDASRTARGVEREPRAGVNQPVRVLFGEFATPGRFWHQNSYGADNEYLQLVFECGRGPVEGLTGLLADGKPMTLSGSNSDPRGRVIDAYTTGGQPRAWVKFHTGAAGQAADPELVARANPPERWPASKTMTGTAYAIVTVRYDEKVFEGGLPDWTFIWRGVKLYDRRKDATMPGGLGSHRWGQPETYEWTANPAIILDNYRRGLWINGVRVLGTGVTAAACHHARTVAAANLCDETITYADTGRTLPRYSFGGEISDAEDQISVVRMLETAMAGFGAEFGGAYAPLPAQTMSSVLTLTDDDRESAADVSQRTRLDPTQVKTAYNGLFVSKADGWVQKEYGLRADLPAESAEGGRRQGKLDLEFITDQETAGMVAEIFKRRDRFSATLMETFGPKAAKLEPGDVITRVNGLLGTVPMMVWAIDEQPGAKYRVTLRRWDNAIVPNPTSGFLPILPDPIAAPVPVRPITVSGLLALAATQVSGPNTVPAIRVTWTPITDRTVDRVLIKYWRDGDPDDARYLSVDDPGAGLAVIEGVVPEAAYVVTATIVTTPPRTTIWSAEAPVTTGALTVSAVPADSSVALEKLTAEMRAMLTWMDTSRRALQRAVEVTGRLVAEQDLANFDTFDQLRRSTQVKLDALTASFDEVIEVALGPGGAIATALSSLYAAMGGNSAEVNVRWEAVAAPAGYAARYAIQAAVNDGTFRAATLLMDVPADPDQPTRIVLGGGQIILATGDDPDDAKVALVVEDGEIKFAGARAGRITSADGTSMITDYDDPEIFMEG